MVCARASCVAESVGWCLNGVVEFVLLCAVSFDGEVECSSEGEGDDEEGEDDCVYEHECECKCECECEVDGKG